MRQSTVAQQSTAQLALQAQITALQATNSTLHAALAAATSQTGDIGLKLDLANARVVELERELREAETVRRKLHNTVQELKGNIRYGRRPVGLPRATHTRSQSILQGPAVLALGRRHDR